MKTQSFKSYNPAVSFTNSLLLMICLLTVALIGVSFAQQAEENPTPNRTEVYKEIHDINMEIFESHKKIRALREQLPPEEIKDYELKDWAGKSVTLSSMFGDKSDLLVIHNMGKHCSYCTLWADGLTGFMPHILSRTALVVVSKDSPLVQKEFAESRDWKFKMLSSEGSPFSFDMGFANDKGAQMPGVSAFHKDKDGKIYRVGWSWFGPGDQFCSPFHYFDLLKDGQGDWMPQFTY